MVMIHVDMGDDFELDDEYDPSLVFFQRSMKLAHFNAHWAALYFGMSLPDEGEAYQEATLRTPKISTTSSGGTLRYKWTIVDRYVGFFYACFSVTRSETK